MRIIQEMIEYIPQVNY